VCPHHDLPQHLSLAELHADDHLSSDAPERDDPLLASGTYCRKAVSLAIKHRDPVQARLLRLVLEAGRVP
jgi:hypothetical protein